MAAWEKLKAGMKVKVISERVDGVPIQGWIGTVVSKNRTGPFQTSLDVYVSFRKAIPGRPDLKEWWCNHKDLEPVDAFEGLVQQALF